jgi:hypothetical protein
MVFGASLPRENPRKFLLLEPNPLINDMIAWFSWKEKWMDSSSLAKSGSYLRRPKIPSRIWIWIIPCSMISFLFIAVSDTLG